jgi:hypothetical protein
MVNEFLEMPSDDTYLSKIVIDVCSRSILLIDNEDNKKFIKCDTVKEFIDVMNFCRSAEEFVDGIAYAELAITT